jgi:DNA-binding MarR family transcriptional regulator
VTTPEEPRWLSAEEQQTWRALTSLLVRLPAALDAQLRRDAGITHFDYQVISQLSEQPGRTLPMSALASLTDSSLQRLSQVVTRLEKRGWITRTPDPHNGRVTRATLTEDGWEKVVATAPGHAAEAHDLVIDRLDTAQQAQLRQIAQRITAAIDEEG